ncbi:hypothetical protein [Caulobacter sp. HMWF009]|nr:hypothetical protein [Caulobacter sp. HMWF009]PTT06490.1 hypothetical protein DBR10_12620 [Caulobacter sp. HMWF025]
MTTTGMAKIQKDSVGLQQLFGWLFGIGVFLVFSEIAYGPLKAVVFAVGASERSEALRQVGESTLGALPVLALLGALWQARGLFKSFAGGQVLSVEAGRTLTRLGDWLVASTILWFIFGDGGSSAAQAFGQNLGVSVVLGCVGIAIRLFGRVIDLAAAVRDDRDQIKSDYDQIV